MEALELIVASDPEDGQTSPTCLLVIMSTQDATLAAPPKPGQSSFYWNKIMFNLPSSWLESGAGLDSGICNFIKLDY